MAFELAFMPNIIKHSGSEAAFKELIDEKLMKDFIETFFGVALI
jgi:hypothetical protein